MCEKNASMTITVRPVQNRPLVSEESGNGKKIQTKRHWELIVMNQRKYGTLFYLFLDLLALLPPAGYGEEGELEENSSNA